MKQAPHIAALRVGLVGPLPPPSGGMANQTRQLAGLLQGEGFAVDTIQVNCAVQPAWAGKVKGLRALCRLLPYLGRLWRAAGSCNLLHVMANSGWSWHLYAAPAIWIGRLRGCPVVVNYRGGEADAFLRKSHSRVRPSLRRADALIVPSGFLEAVFAKYGFQAQIVPNIVNLERFSAAPAKAAGTPLRLLVARNLEPIYDNATALRAFAMVRAVHPDAELVVAGSGPLRAELEALARELGIAGAVRFTGRVDNQGMAALYHEADAMLNPTLIDNTPNSVIEALACGVPVVSTRVGGVPYLVEDGKTALLVGAGAPREMADAVLRLAADPQLAAALRERGLLHVRQFAWSEVRPRLLACYDAVLNPVPASVAANP